MRWNLTVVSIVAVLTGASVTFACAYSSTEVLRALSSNAEVRSKAIAQLREAGPAGLEDVAALLDLRREQLASAADTNREHLQSDILRLEQLMDEIGGAKYCAASKLYWFTDFDRAKAEATRTNRPIICLRMMGKLTEEFSCANSRFFRTTLYVNEDISQTLRRDYVLHWESVRPVPRVTIDFGDGRKLERTLTGNSIHYIVDAEGRPLDGLPGLYGPQAFKQWLERGKQLAQSLQGKELGERNQLLRAFHEERLSHVREAFAADLRKVTHDYELAAEEVTPVRAGQQAERALRADALAAPKSQAETPLLRQTLLVADLPQQMEDLDDATWQQIADLHAEDAKLDDASERLIRAEAPNAVEAGRRAFGKRRIEDPLARLVRKFQSSIALDTVRNEYVLHRQLHTWFATSELPTEVQSLNERVYAELFLTPSSDPWLGLMSPDTYSALRNNGMVVEPVKVTE